MAATRRSAAAPSAAVSSVVASASAPTEPDSGVRRTHLPGGLRVVTEHVPGVRSAAVGVWVGVGSRDEQPSVAGAAHFLEHLLFKATPTRTALDIAELVDGVGGELNAFTAKEHTCFYAHVLDDDLPLAVDLVADVVLRGRCRSADVDVERQVVLEEIAMRDDDPEDLLGDAFLTALYGDHPIGRPIIGSVESIEAMTRTQLHSFHVRRYTPDRMVVAVAGNVDHDHTVELVRRAFAGHLDPATTAAPRREGSLRLRTTPTLSITDRDGEQAHLAVGVRSFGRHDHRRWALSVLNTAVGGGLSSRLFQEIREKRGLAYSVYSGVDTFADTGAFSVYAGCQPENLGEVAALVREVLADVAENGVTEAECARAKGSLRGALVLGLEDTGARMNRIGRSELSYGTHWSVTETLERISSVSAAEVRAVAAELLHRPFAAAVAGPYRRPRDLPASVRVLVA
ncbi:zinc protease [Rhodococcus sp. WB1]|jgi:predicted Zn-dependent peptidase|uniref:Insulinase family protein n=1 Tax=Rhodococcus aetherivorans TaxID=191292 RepID=A0AA46P7H2_9NOCA|nr:MULTISPECIES: pitrilysin family protein [Rhodococcus]NCL77034.1 putative zinc protease [Rhodococcus sp. YH1]AKE89797.1 zinc protease [Rhodococcus aetherivorans]ANZ25481.1 zinc protease [Rhodococcus sp. WB1]KDE13924.1 zinc protease [Rhodococcus aetherivorans]MDV6291720.1 pitrilysin family protein [Rhodococcus aetherivorans]